MPPESVSMLRIDSLSVHYGLVAALTGVNLAVGDGEIVALLGSNGAGKSTLMRTIVGLVTPVAGAIEFRGNRIEHLPVEQRVRDGVSIVLEGRGMLPRMSVQDNLLMGAYMRSEGVDEDIERVLEMFPVLRARARQAAGTLSGGEQQMLAIARALMQRPKLLLLDEPSLGLAPVIVERVFETIQKINSDGTTVLLVEQNARIALSISHRFYILRTGEVVLDGEVANGSLVVTGNDGVRKTITEEALEAAYLDTTTHQKRIGHVA
jgi:branched-chain amino acid transport system ATP-binding protein